LAFFGYLLAFPPDFSCPIADLYRDLRRRSRNRDWRAKNGFVFSRKAAVFLDKLASFRKIYFSAIDSSPTICRCRRSRLT
jgi:hypothetical protein